MNAADSLPTGIALLHDRPAHPWTLADLAKTIATSRTVLAERFTDVVAEGTELAAQKLAAQAA